MYVDDAAEGIIRATEVYDDVLPLNIVMGVGTKIIELVAKIEGKSKKKTVDLLLEAGFSSYMGAKLKEHIKNEQKIKELNLERHQRTTRFVKEVRKFCKERGLDIRKII